jgi:phosphatidate phosphatase APP1
VRLGTAIVLCLLALPAYAGSPRGVIELHWGFGTPSRFLVTGRVLKDKGVRAPALHRTSTDNLIDTVRVLETDEVEGAVVEIRVRDRRLRGTTDDDGNCEIRAENIHPPLPVGDHEMGARLVVDRGFRTPPAEGRVRILPDEPIVIVLSDMDDTVIETGAKNLAAIAKNALLRNAAQLKPVPGVAAAYRAAIDEGAAAFFYLSGSPLNFHERFQHFHEQHGLPRGPIFLKNFGSENLTEQEGYKGRKLETLHEMLPRARLVMLGDSGEHDPEIYAAFRKRHPDNVVGIAIRKAHSDRNKEKSARTRFRGITLVEDWAERPRLVADFVKAALNDSDTPEPEARH